MLIDDAKSLAIRVDQLKALNAVRHFEAGLIAKVNRTQVQPDAGSHR